MMKCLPALLILLTLLSGCAAAPGAESPLETVAQESPGAIHDLAELEGFSYGELQGYPLEPGTKVFPVGKDRLLLVNSGTDAALLTLVEGSSMSVAAQRQISFPLQPEEYSVRPCGGGISCYDSTTGETVVLDEWLQECYRIKAPENALGSPLLSGDGTLLFYCTGDAIRVLELSGGISRILKKTDCSQLTLTGLLLEDAALQYIVTGESGVQTVLISTATGGTLYFSREETAMGSAWGNLYVSESGVGVFGPPGADQMALYPRRTSERILFLPENHGAITLSPEGEAMWVLEYYDLESGLRTGSLTLPDRYPIRGCMAGPEGKIWLWGEPEASQETVLYVWNPEDAPTGDPQVYVDAYFPRENPDWQGLSRCEEYARELEERYAIEIRIGAAAVQTQPDGFRLEYEHHVPQLMRTLQLLEHCLGQYPPGFVQTVAAQFEALTICLVRSIRETDTQERCDGLQFWDGNQALVALGVGVGAEGACYHQLCHLMDTVVYNESSAYDVWQNLNPTGFRYDYSYIANRNRNSTVYLQDANRAFVDMFSMSFPREDRARIMEYAMLPGNEVLFRSDTMQKKLRTLCTGIREAFALEDAEETFLWEQYLR